MKKILLVFLTLFPHFLFSQLQTNQLPYYFYNNVDEKIAKQYSINNFDATKYLLEDQKNLFEKRFRFAINREVDIHFDFEKYIKTDSSKIYYLKIAAPNTQGISLIFSNFYTNLDFKLFIFDPKLHHVIGAITKNNSKNSKILPTKFIPSDTILVELQLPLSNEQNPAFYISDIGLAYRPIKDDIDWCEIDINCNKDPRWQKLKKAVTKIYYKEDKSSSYFVCTGTMMANTALDNTPYVLTANHCIHTQKEANSAVFYFNYENSDCDIANSSEAQTIAGSKLVATADEMLDFTLLQLSEVPPPSYNPYYAGWDRTPSYSDTSICIHHPEGKEKKISISYAPPEIGSFTNYDSHKHWQIKRWHEGTTEKGSSGAGLFTTEMQLIGNLSGGDASCDHNIDDYFQQFYHAWDDYNLDNRKLNIWLDPFRINPNEMQGYFPHQNTDLQPPTSFDATISDDTLISINWEAPHPTPDKYIIYKNLKPILETNTPTTVQDIINSDGVYVYFATAIYADKESKPSAMKSFAYGDTSTVKKITRIEVFPNPSSQIFYLRTPDSIPVTKIEVIALNGQILKKIKYNSQKNLSLNLSDLPTAPYLLKISTLGDIYIKKILLFRTEK